MTSSPFARRVRRLAKSKGLLGASSSKTGKPGQAAGPQIPAAIKRSTSAPGSRVVESMFFDDYPRFYDTSETSPYHGRLNLRHDAIFVENKDIFQGKRVLDISSHDGRWTFAALNAGAASVVGIEARPELVANSIENLEHYGVSADRYKFYTGDVFDVMAKEKIEVDVVLCLGFIYHTLRYNELMSRIRECNPDYVIIDTAVTSGTRALMQLKLEEVSLQGNAVADEFSRGDAVLTGKPTIKGLRMIAKAYDYDLEKFSDWGGLVRDNPKENGVRDYSRQMRVTARLKARSKDGTPTT